MAIIGFSEIGAFQGISGGPDVISNPTSIQFGPDGRLYVAEQNGSINAFEVQVDSNGQYIATAHEELLLPNSGGIVKSIMNHNDKGVNDPFITNRQVTGIVVTGTAQNPVLYISSSDPRIATNNDSNLDTNSGVLTKVSWNGSNWEAVDLIRGLPRSEENHSVNGMVLSEDETKLYLAVGGNTNNGAPSQFFTYTGEYALSGTVLEIDLTDLESRTVLTDDDGGKISDGSGGVNAVARDYIYDIPTLDDPNIENITDGVGEDANGLDEDGPFGGNDGLNMAILPADAPFRIYADGLRNNYDLVLRENGQLLTVDNGSNGGLGANPLDENGNPTDQSGLPPTNTPNDGGTGDPEPLFLLEDGGYYGHPAPARSNQDLAWTVFNDNAEPNPDLSVSSVNDLSAQVPAGVNIPDGFIIDPSKFTDDAARLLESGIRVERSSSDSNAIVTIGSSSNGLTEYTSTVFDGALAGALLVAQFNNNLTLLNLNDAGTALEPLIDPGDDGQLGTADDETIDADGVYPLLTGFSTPLDVIEGPNGTIWVAEIGGDFIKVFAPTGPTPDDNDFDDDGLLNVEDPFIRDATNGGSVVINPGNQLLWDFDANQDDNLPGPDGYGGGLTGVMIDGQTDFEAVFQEPSSIDGQDIKLDNVKFITAAGGGTTVVENVSNGDALETFNNGEYLFHTGLTVSPFVDTLTVQWDVINPSTSFTGLFQQIGSYLGTGDQNNYLKLATSQGDQGEIQVLLEDDDVVISESFIQADNLFTVPADQSPNISFALDIDLINDKATPTITYDTTGGTNTVFGDSIDLTGTTVLDAIEGNYQVQSQTSGLALGLFSTNRGQDPANSFPAIFSGIEVTATGQEADLELTKTVDNNSPNIGDPVTFTLTVDNTGSDEATSVSVIDSLPEGFNYVSDTGNGTYDPSGGIWDIGSMPNSSSATLDITAQVVEAFESSVLYRVNAGGPLIEATDDNLNWSQDLASDNSPFLSNPGSNSTFGTSSAIAFNPSVPLGTPEAIFQQERWDSGSANDGDEMQWAFPVDPGSEVEVRLYFAEIFSGITGVGERVFDVAVEGVVPASFDDIDPFAIAGFNTGFVLSDTFTIDDGTLNLELIHNLQNPAIKGIEILTTGTSLDSNAYINSAEIFNSDQLDPDSTPNNSSTNEDDDASVTLMPGFDNNVANITAITADAAEPNSNGQFQVSLNTAAATETVINYTIAGTATAGSDYETLSGTVTITEGQLSAEIDVVVLDDSDIEEDETVVVTLTEATGDANIQLGGTTEATVNIIDNDPATPIVSIVGGPYTVTEGNSVQVSLLSDVTVPSDETVQVTFQIVPGTATPQEDYTYQSTNASFDEQTGVYTDTISIAGSSSDATFFIDALQDTLLENNEALTVEITNISPNAEIGTTNSASVTIEDDDSTADNVVAAINAGGPALMQDGIDFVADTNFLNGNTFTDSSASNGSQPVFDGTIYETERWGNPLNYEIPVAPGNYFIELHFAEIYQSNIGERVFDVSVEGQLVFKDLDILAETGGDINQPLVLQVPDPISPETFGATDAIDVDFSASMDNAKISGIVIFSSNLNTLGIATTTEAAEPDVNGQFTLTFTEAVTTETTVAYTVTGTAKDGSDYTALTGTATIAANTSSAVIDVSVLDDNLIEEEETITVTLDSISSGDSNVVIGSSDTATMTLTDDEVSNELAIATALNAAEPDVNGQFTLTLNQAVTTDTTVAYTVAGTATADTDYTALTGTATITANTSSTVIDVSVLDDSLFEAEETVTVTLDRVVSGDSNVVIGSSDTATATLTDDETSNIVTAINAGGPALMQDGIDFVADTNFLNGNTFTDSSASNGSQPVFDGTIYETERWGNPLNYEIPVAPGNYFIELHFAEIYQSNIGERVFDVSVEGQLVFKDLDILAETGGDINQPLVLQVPDPISPETFGATDAIDVDFSASMDNAKISGIMISSSNVNELSVATTTEAV